MVRQCLTLNPPACVTEASTAAQTVPRQRPTAFLREVRSVPPAKRDEDEAAAWNVLFPIVQTKGEGMNCKPGDLAVIVHPKSAGKLVSVLHAVPGLKYTLPDGYPAMANVDGKAEWVCESLGSSFTARLSSGELRYARYAGIHDQWLRPIRPTDGEDETLQWAGKPNEVTA